MTLITRTLGAGYCAVADVRRVSGVLDNDVSDADVSDLIVQASLIFTDAVATRHESVPMTADATGLSFTLPYPYVADLNVDGIVDAADLTVRYERHNAATGLPETMSPGVVTLVDARSGRLSTTVPLDPSQGWAAVCDFGTYRRPLDLTRAKRAVSYLAAHLCALKVRGPGRITRADLIGVGDTAAQGQAVAWAIARTKFLTLYEREVAALRGQAVF